MLSITRALPAAGSAISSLSRAVSTSVVALEGGVTKQHWQHVGPACGLQCDLGLVMMNSVDLLSNSCRWMPLCSVVFGIQLVLKVVLSDLARA